MSSLVTGFFFPVSCLNLERWSPPLKVQTDWSTFHITCDFPSTVVFIENILNFFLMWISKFSLNLLLLFRRLLLLLTWTNISRSTLVSSLYVNSCISLVLCFLFSDIFVSWYCHIYQYARFFLYFLNYCTWPICHNYTICVLLYSTTLLRLHVGILVAISSSHFSVVSMRSALYIE